MSCFISFEGGEGSGKSTQARKLAAHFAASGISHCLTREPGGAPGAEALREILLFGGHEFAPLAEIFLHFAARADHVAATIRPALARGEIVICDRFSDSTMAYQGYGSGADRAQIDALAAMIGIAPDITFVLQASEAVAASRLAARGGRSDRYEGRDAAFHARVRAGFAEIAAKNPQRCVLIDADGAIETVHGQILAALAARFLP